MIRITTLDEDVEQAPGAVPSPHVLHDRSDRELIVALVGAADRRRTEARSATGLVDGGRRVTDLEDALVSELRSRRP
jgi:hypothetical protein